MAINDGVGAVFVLSVRSFTDRIAHIEAEMARNAVEFEFIFEFDANAIPEPLIEATFAPSELTRPQQSLVLKHIRALQLAVERNLQRILVFEDDAVLAPGFAARFERVVAEAAALQGPYLVYLGRGNNQHVGRRADGELVPGGALPATDALLIDQASARLRLDYLKRHKVTRPADWWYREVDAALGIPHYWLREPLVEQGSMNGRFESVLDGKRRVRGRWYSWLRYRWDAWWKRLRQDMGLR